MYSSIVNKFFLLIVHAAAASFADLHDALLLPMAVVSFWFQQAHPLSQSHGCRMVVFSGDISHWSAAMLTGQQGHYSLRVAELFINLASVMACWC